MIEIIRKVLNNKPTNIDEILKFIEYCWGVNNPGNTTYSQKNTETLINMGFYNQIMTYYVASIFEDPSKYKIEILTLKDQEGQVIKNEIK